MSNGRLFPYSMDGRSVTARRFRDIYEEIGSDMGGQDLLSEGQRQLARRAAGISVLSEEIESDLVNTRPFSVQNYLWYSNSLKRIFESLGLQRVSRDVSPRLADYLQAVQAPSGPPTAAESGSGATIPQDADSSGEKGGETQLRTGEVDSGAIDLAADAEGQPATTRDSEAAG